VRVARLVVVPVQPFPLDPVGDGGNTQNRARRGLIVVVNLVPPRSRLTECIGADFASTGTPIAATWIGNRVASAQAVALGLGVTKTPYDPRSAEISALAEEIPGALLGFEPRLERQENSADPMGYRFLPARNRKFESISLHQRVMCKPDSSNIVVPDDAVASDEAEHVQREASGVFAGDDQTVNFIGLISGTILTAVMLVARALSQSISYSVGRWWANSGC
jgi:hypothetical protein